MLAEVLKGRIAMDTSVSAVFTYLLHGKYLSDFPIWARSPERAYIQWSPALRFSLVAFVVEHVLDMALFQDKKASGSSLYSELVIALKFTPMDIIFALTPEVVLLVIFSLSGLETIFQ